MSISQFITRTLAKRKETVPRLRASEEALSELSAEIERLVAMALRLGEDEGVPPEFATFSDLPSALKTFLEAISHIQPKLTALRLRFDKDSLNIGVAGRARQGKSTIIQAITGLPDYVIPTSRGLPCTGARSKIVHQEHGSRAALEFFTEKEFISEIVGSYYEELDLYSPPRCIADFEKPLPPIQENHSHTQKAVYTKLREIHESIPRFKTLLSKPTLSEDLERIRDYVSQEDGRKNYLAVKMANIYAPFLNKDAAGLAIVDLPGLGEVARGHDRKLTASLQQEVDAVILIKYPESTGTHWDELDFKVFDIIDRSVPEVSIEDWLFVVLNRGPDNHLQVKLLADNPPNTRSPLKILTADCTDRQEVDEVVFCFVLQHLQSNLERIDRKHLEGIAQGIRELVQELKSSLFPIQNFLNSLRQGDREHERFDALFDEFMRSFTDRLELITEKFFQQSLEDIYSEPFKKAVDNVCDHAETAPPIPSCGELEVDFRHRGGWPHVVQERLHQLRAHLTQELTGLDACLKRIVESALDALATEIGNSAVGTVIKSAGQQDRRTRLLLLDLHGALDKARHPTMTTCLNYILNFDLSYHSHFHYRVREKMFWLDPMSSADLPGKYIPSNAKAENAEDIERALTEAYRRVVFEVRQVLTDAMYSDPLKAVFALIEEFKDRMVRTKGVEKEWKNFLREHRSEAWPQEFDRFQAETGFSNSWKRCIEKALMKADEVISFLEI